MNENDRIRSQRQFSYIFKIKYVRSALAAPIHFRYKIMATICLSENPHNQRLAINQRNRYPGIRENKPPIRTH